MNRLMQLAAGAAVIVASCAGAFASPLLIYDVRIDSVTGGVMQSSKLATVTGSASTVTMSLYAFILSSDGNSKNDGFLASAYGLRSNGALLGNLSSSVASSMRGTGYQTGDNIDLDSDGDLDVGATPNAASGWQRTSAYCSPSYSYSYDLLDTIGGSSYVGFRMATATFTVSTGAIDGLQTQIVFMPRTGTSVKPHKFTFDGSSQNNQNLAGDSGLISVLSGPVIQGTPEPATLGLLGLGGLGLLARRRRRLC